MAVRDLKKRKIWKNASVKQSKKKLAVLTQFNFFPSSTESFFFSINREQGLLIKISNHHPSNFYKIFIINGSYAIYLHFFRTQKNQLSNKLNQQIFSIPVFKLLTIQRFNNQIIWEKLREMSTLVDSFDFGNLSPISQGHPYVGFTEQEISFEGNGTITSLGFRFQEMDEEEVYLEELELEQIRKKRNQRHMTSFEKEGIEIHGNIIRKAAEECDYSINFSNQSSLLALEGLADTTEQFIFEKTRLPNKIIQKIPYLNVACRKYKQMDYLVSSLLKTLPLSQQLLVIKLAEISTKMRKEKIRQIKKMITNGKLRRYLRKEMRQTLEKLLSESKRCSEMINFCLIVCERMILCLQGFFQYQERTSSQSMTL